MHISEIETPSILVDLDIVEKNIAKLQDRCNSLGIKNRPHIKTHKIPDIARMQLEAGAVGISCQKVSEAQVFADAGFNDIQIPYPIIGEAKTARLADMAIYNKVTTIVDSMEGVEGLSAAARDKEVTIHILVDIETPMQRTGAKMHQILPMVKRIEADENLHFAGITAYPGDVRAKPIFAEAIAMLDAQGIGVDVVSAGGSGVIPVAHEMDQITELRAGTYVYWDWRSMLREWCTVDECAATVAATVVSSVDPKRVILDAGSKALSNDVQNDLYGYVKEYPEARIYRLSEEHGNVDFSMYDIPPRVGERVHIIPVHVCVAINMHDNIVTHRGGVVEQTLPVAARGKMW